MSHVWDDTEEAVACAPDKHVAELLKYEVKQEFPAPRAITAACGADLSDLLGSPALSKHSNDSSRSVHRKRPGKGLKRQHTVMQKLGTGSDYTFQSVFLALPN